MHPALRFVELRTHNLLRASNASSSMFLRTVLDKIVWVHTLIKYGDNDA